MDDSTVKKELPPVLSYCLYARKSSEDEERQALSIESQISEMNKLAERDHLSVVTVKTEAHSAKNSGEREVFNKMIDEIKAGKYNAILTWHPDRLSRNAGDLGRLIDLMDSKQLLEIKTYNQNFSNSPNEKFLLMILGSQAKLENDTKGINVKRGLRTLVEKGLWPGVAPLGYTNVGEKGNRGIVKIDPIRAHIVQMMFEKAAEGWSQHHIRDWLTDELDFRSPNGKHVALSGVQLALTRTFYYGMFEYPKKSGNWYHGVHQPLITKELFEKVREEMKKKRRATRIYKKDFAYTHLIKCGLCGSSVTAEEKFKALKDGTIARYVYYGCSRTQDHHCPMHYIREEDLIKSLCEIVDELSINELGVRGQMDLDVDRMYRFHRDVLGDPGGFESKELGDIDTKKYMKFLLKDGNIHEQRHVLSNLKSKLILKDGKISVDKTESDELLKDVPPVSQPISVQL
ncbi:MAG TPA: recombinase family protein [Candidatus Paceibacterota bacterium]|jgi:DNA invertase Pin-like site-specific DNA recombinase|nr:recombinase family protein [Candidatus Paceibacterota bacterium]